MKSSLLLVINHRIGCRRRRSLHSLQVTLSIRLKQLSANGKKKERNSIMYDTGRSDRGAVDKFTTSRDHAENWMKLLNEGKAVSVNSSIRFGRV